MPQACERCWKRKQKVSLASPSASQPCALPMQTNGNLGASVSNVLSVRSAIACVSAVHTHRLNLYRTKTGQLAEPLRGELLQVTVRSLCIRPIAPLIKPHHSDWQKAMSSRSNARYSSLRTKLRRHRHLQGQQMHDSRSTMLKQLWLAPMNKQIRNRAEAISSMRLSAKWATST